MLRHKTYGQGDRLMGEVRMGFITIKYNTSYINGGEGGIETPIGEWEVRGR